MKPGIKRRGNGEKKANRVYVFLTFPDNFLENVGAFPDYKSEMGNIFPDQPVVQMMRATHL